VKAPSLKPSTGKKKKKKSLVWFDKLCLFILPFIHKYLLGVYLVYPLVLLGKFH
jgi:hypothetical protein